MAWVAADSDYYFSETVGVSFRDFNLNALLSFESFIYVGDIDLVVEGRSFEDLVGYVDDELDGVSFAGKGIRVDDEQMVSGTVTAVDIDDWEVGIVVGILDVSLAATQVMSAMLSPTFSDDLALWASAFSGNDVFALSEGDDDMRGFDGADRMYGKAGDDTLRGNDGDDRIWGGADADLLLGQRDEDTLFGGSGRDRLLGGEDKDVLNGGAGVDALFGGGDADLLMGDSGADLLRGDAGSDRLKGGDHADVLFGGAGADAIYGNLKDDRLIGGAGNDRLFGGGGRDELNGGAGDDALYGGQARDVFVFNGIAGTDEVLDFQAGIDQLHFRKTADAQQSDLSFSQDGDWLVIEHAGGRVRLMGYSEENVANDWFQFA